jgi:hypothetical protein
MTTLMRLRIRDDGFKIKVTRWKRLRLRGYALKLRLQDGGFKIKVTTLKRLRLGDGCNAIKVTG